MKILYSHYLADDAHPAVQMIHAIGTELRRLGHEVLIHRSHGPESVAAMCRDTKQSASQSRFLGMVKGRLWFAKAMARNIAMGRRDRAILKQFKPDIVLARQDAYCWSMPRACVQAQTPLVTYADAPVAFETRLFGEKTRWHPPGVLEAIEKRGLSRSCAVVTVSHPAAMRLQDYGLHVPIHVVPNGVNPDRFPGLSPTRREAARKAWGLIANRIIGFQGTFRPFHGLDLLRDLMLASASYPDIQWLLIGDGPGRAELQRAVSGRVSTVFTGMQPAERLGELLSLIDIAVVPHVHLASDFYFCPLKILEFAAAGCAVIASEQGDIPRLLDNGRAGMLVANSDLASWTSALEYLLADDQRRLSLGRYARRFVLSNYTWRHTALAVVKVLQGVLNQENISGK